MSKKGTSQSSLDKKPLSSSKTEGEDKTAQVPRSKTAMQRSRSRSPDLVVQRDQVSPRARDKVWNWKLGNLSKQSLVMQGRDVVVRKVLDSCADVLLSQQFPPLVQESVFEVPPDALEEEDDWEWHATARAVGVKALQSLATRHTQALAEKEFSEEVARQSQMELTTLRAKISELASVIEGLQNDLLKERQRSRDLVNKEKELKATHAVTLDRLTQTKGQEKNRLTMEMEKLKDNNARMKSNFEQVESDMAKLETQYRHLESRCRELEHGNILLLADASSSSAEAKAMQQEVKKLDENFSYARKRLASVNNYMTGIENDNQKRTHDAENKIKLLETMLAEEKTARVKISNDMTDVINKKDEELERLRAVIQQDAFKKELQIVELAKENDMQRQEIEMLRAKIDKHVLQRRWMWLIVICQLSRSVMVRDVQLQTENLSSVQTVSTQTDMKVVSNETKKTNKYMSASLDINSISFSTTFAQVHDKHLSVVVAFLNLQLQFLHAWHVIVDKANRLEMEDVKQIAMSPDALLEKINMWYSRKVVVDQLDDYNQRKRQHLAHFVFDSILCETGQAEQGFEKMIVLVANVLQYVLRPDSTSSDSNKKTTKNTEDKGKQPPANQPTAVRQAEDVVHETNAIVRRVNKAIAKFSSMITADPKALALSRRMNPQQKLEHWIEEQRVDKFEVMRISMFATLLGINPNKRWDVDMQQEAADLYLEAAVQMRKGQLPLLPSNTAEGTAEVFIAIPEMAAAIDEVCGNMRAVERQKMRTKIEQQVKELRGGKMLINLDKALELLVDLWKTTMSAEGKRLPSSRQMLRMYSQMSVCSSVDAGVFCKVARQHELGKIQVGKISKSLKAGRQLEEQEKVFALLEQYWRGMEGSVQQVASTLSKSPEAQELEELVALFRILMQEKSDPAQAFHTYRLLVQEFQSVMDRGELKKKKKELLKSSK
ncbi:hypothetical protein GUITHDRAFT_109075 [Guillardia theta CCMP2712]|uniref:Uncharacterized protein n=1 Tax=Guillardia theta (strain CCMP2712) TaxID=905079 RepID=L1JAB5_GUITC|nr:hypothetical protein GUITHDRAFT_109075 [Guillardia theta CCMP2712]EKX45030.1 hypothetical protein GUITHDRAFT_109075 [Guillardia theta CCMP2712]|eukprot:XP_005832010.1 hypothetical protein GUITHDRAFT_109075 [Guillardia theta CCMP2712]